MAVAAGSVLFGVRSEMTSRVGKGREQDMSTQALKRTDWENGHQPSESVRAKRSHLVLVEDLPLANPAPRFELADFPPSGFLYIP